MKWENQSACLTTPHSANPAIRGQRLGLQHVHAVPTNLIDSMSHHAGPTRLVPTSLQSTWQTAALTFPTAATATRAMSFSWCAAIKTFYVASNLMASC